MTPTVAQVRREAERALGTPVFLVTWRDEHGNWFGEASNAWGAIHVLTSRRRFALKALYGALREVAS